VTSTRVIPEAPGDWLVDAECNGVDPDLFFPKRGEDATAAKAVCARCVARFECLEYALDENIMHGVWGGLSGRERRRIRSSRIGRAC
jgi:WhiB family redox-sensing transcriptional regulator